MRIWKFMLMVVAILSVSATCQSGYKELVSDWNDWTPPEYIDPNTSKKNIKTLLPESKDKKELPTGYSVWESRLENLLKKGKFIQNGGWPFDGKRLGIKESQVILSSALHLKDIERIGLQRNPAILSAIANYRAELDGFDQVEGLDAVLSRYSAFTKGVMTGVGPMKGRGGCPNHIQSQAQLLLNPESWLKMLEWLQSL